MGLIFYTINYFVWHYTRGIKDLVLIWVNFIWFIFNYFSIKLLLQTLLSPWKRIGEEKKGFFDLTFIVIDIFMRIFGAIIRTITLFIGILAVLLVVVLGFIAVAVWTFWPVIIGFLFIRGFELLSK